MSGKVALDWISLIPYLSISRLLLHSCHLCLDNSLIQIVWYFVSFKLFYPPCSLRFVFEWGKKVMRNILLQPALESHNLRAIGFVVFFLCAYHCPCPAISLTIYGYNLLCERSRSFANNSLNAREGNYAGIFKIRTQRPNRPGTNRGFFYSIYFFVCWIESTGVISIERKGLRAGYHASKITDFISLF